MKSYAIADFDSVAGEDEFFRRLSELSDSGVDFIQLRARKLGGAALMRAAERCRAIIPGDGPRFLVSGRPDVASAARADGVHLASRGMPVEAARAVDPALIVGRSCHSLLDASRAQSEGADYVLLGPVFRVRSKPGEPAVTMDEMRMAAAGGPTFALGGISLENLQHLCGSGLEGVAAITMFLLDRPLEPIVRAVREC
ncbi:MAG TPA: thiamine phosphate synthase [Thermoanaerobaculia bacterium]|nr:thiamine phosphate synthase [Thermoanaerobaculia bacterium]